MSDLPPISADWNNLGDIPVRKSLVYDVNWLPEGQSHLVAIAPYGGPIAVTRSVSHLPKESSSKSREQTTVNIFSAGGTSIGVANWSSPSPIVCMGWDVKEEQLVVVGENARAIKYTINGTMLSTHNLNAHEKDERITECKYWHTSFKECGFAWKTSNVMFYSCKTIDMRIRPFHTFTDVVTAWTPLVVTLDNRQTATKIIVASQGKVFSVTTDDAVQLNLHSRVTSEPLNWVAMSVNVHSNRLAMVDGKGFLWMGTVDLNKCLCEFQMDGPDPILAMEWISPVAVAIVTPSYLFVKGPREHWLKDPLFQSCYLQPEIDGCRMLYNASYEFYEIVPEASKSVGAMGSLDPGAVLNDAYSEYQGGDGGKAHEYIRFIEEKNLLTDGISQCIKAASEMTDPVIQKQLMKAAHFGRSFLKDGIPPLIVDDTVYTIQALRILNEIRAPEVGMPLTIGQYNAQSPMKIISRLTKRELYPLSISICRFLKLSPEEGELRVLIEWAINKMKHSHDNPEAIAKAIIRRLNEYHVNIPYAELARSAKELKLPQLAKLLLSHETSIHSQVPFLLELGEYDRALDQAVLSGDPDLILTALHTIKQTRAADLPYKLATRPEADALYKKYMTDAGLNVIVAEVAKGGGHGSLYSEADAQFQYEDYYKGSFNPSLSVEQKNKLIMKAKVAYNLEDSAGKYIEQAIRERADLLLFQEKVGKAKNLNLVGRSLFDTMNELMEEDEMSTADRLAKDFKVSDNLYWQAKVDALSNRGEWMALERFSKSKKPPPIGFEPFVDACLAHKNTTEAERYVEKAPPNIKWKLFLKIGNPMKAAESAFHVKDSAALRRIYDSCQGSVEIKNSVESYLSRLPK